MQVYETASAANVALRHEVSAGLLAESAAIAPKFFYDELGSRLFEAICELDEYQPTRAEAEIYASHGTQIAATCGAHGVFIDLGAGNCEKAARLLPVLKPSVYMPVDISGDFLLAAVAALKNQFPGLSIRPLIQDFSSGLRLPGDLPQNAGKLFFYPGSTLGNFTPLAAQRFLGGLAATGGALLLGVDLVKDADALKAAYDDSLGVTAAFNRNILRNVNRELGSDFNPSDWDHVAFFNTTQSRIEMHLEARRALTVRWPDGKRSFAAGERIHTEYSYKFTRESISAMLRQAGFGSLSFWTDTAGGYLVCHAAPRGN